MSPVAITVAITILMAVLFLSGKFPFGLITMTCCVLLVLTGVLPISSAFSGLSNQMIIMVASMFALSSALQKTDLSFKLKGMLSAMSGKKDMALVVVLFAIYFVMLLIMPGIVAMALIIGFLDALPDTGEVTPSRIIMPLLMFNVVWEGTMPIGMGATIDFTTNAYMENIVAENQLLQFMNTFSVKIVPALIMIPICLVAWKLFPKKKLSLDSMQTKEMTKSDLPQWKQNFIYACFILVVIVLVLTVGMFIYLKYCKQGYEIAVVGESENTARYAGIQVKKVIVRTMAISGAICGIAGFVIVSGASHTISTATAGGRGFTAIIVAWLSKFNTFIMVAVSFGIVFMNQGAVQIATQYGLNENASDVLLGIILFFLIGAEFFINYRVKRAKK